MTSRSSFLHAASYKAAADKKLRGNLATGISNDGSLRLLLVEEENETDGTIISSNNAMLARSLVMDAAYSMAINSSVPCRGCHSSSSSDNGEAEGCSAVAASSESATPMMTSSCRCCRVALLIPGELKMKKSKNKKRRRNGNINIRSNDFADDTGRAIFPLSCICADGGEDIMETSDADANYSLDQDDALRHVQIKYVKSIRDVIRFLAYAPSLPQHLQPLDGIILFGLGDLLLRERTSGYRDASVMKFTHTVSLLKDTANILGDTRRELLKSNTDIALLPESKYCDTDVSIIATVDRYTYTSIPPKVITYVHHWIDYVASIQQQTQGGSSHNFTAYEDSTTNPNEWELMYKCTGLGAFTRDWAKTKNGHDASFGFKIVNGCDESSETHKIIWKV